MPDFTNPDLTTSGSSIDIPCVTDINNNVITGAYTITYAVTDNTSTIQTPLSRQFDFNWIEPSNGITNLSDVVIPEVVFRDVTSYSPIGSFTGTLTRTLSSSFPSTSEASANSPITSTSTNTITVVSGANYYEGSYTPTSNVSVAYTHSSNAWLTILYTRTFSKTFAVKKCPNQLELIGKINTYRGIIDAYKETNDTQFNILSEQYDLVIALYSHLIARYTTNTQDGSEAILRELLSILEPYTGAYTYQATKMLPFELTSSGSNSFNISDGTNIDPVPLGSTLTFSSGNASLVPIVTNNVVTYSPTFGTAINTFAQGNDARFHNPVTIGTANGLSISTQALSLAAATSGSAGAMSAADKTKLDGIATGATANTGTVTSVSLTTPAAFTVTGSPITTAGTLAIAAAGTSLQYITGAGALATLNTANVPENTNLYFTTSRARTSISLTTTGTTGAATYDNATGVLNIPSYIGGVTSFNTRTGAIVLSSADVTTALTYTPVPSNRTLTINGTSFDLSADRSWTIASGVTSFNTRTGAITPTAGDYTTALVTEVTNLYYTDARARAAISLTTTGTSGSATYNNTTGVLNIPAYQGGVTSFNTRTGAITLTSGDVTTALTYTPENAANKGIANGYASLDGGGLVPSTQLPSYVDDVLEYTNLATFPASGTTGKIYVALDTNKIYRWSGATYIEVSPTVGTIWGGITGTLSNQTDLQNALNLKYNTPTGTTAQYVAGDGSLIAFPVAGQSGTIVRLVRNTTGATLTKGTVVYISGATGNNPIVSKAIATGDSTSAQTFGLLQADIANNATGYVVTMGDLIGLDTSAFTEGQQVYLSGTVAGTYTATKTLAPTHLVYIGVITRAHPTLGQIEVKIQNGYELDELHDVSAQNPANNDIIAYNTSSGLWEKKSIATTLGYTPVSGTGTANYLPKFTGTTAIGNSLVYDNGTSVGIGTTTLPSIYKLVVNGALNTLGGYVMQDDSGNFAVYSSDGLISTGGFSFNRYLGVLIHSSNTNPIKFQINGGELMRMFSSKNISINTTVDAGYRLDVNGTARIQNALTLSGSVTGVGNLSNYTVTASAGSAISKKITSTLVASANSDVLVGLDINPTFTNGAFTGVTNYGVRINGSILNTIGSANLYTSNVVGGTTITFHNTTPTTSNYFFRSDGTNTGFNSGSNTGGYLYFRVGNINYGQFMSTTGNFTLQNGGTFTDAGYRLDVAGTTRFQGTTASDTAPLGSELAAVTGTGTNWTLAGTNLNVGGYTHTTGSVVPLTTSLAAVSGTYYQITYTITGRTTGSITIAYGGASLAFINASGNRGPLTSSTAVLTITPTTDFDGTIVLSIKSIGSSSASSTFANSAGTSNIEVRANSITSNTFIGLSAGSRNTTATGNSFIGANAGQSNTTGFSNTFIGNSAGQNITIASENVAVGTAALLAGGGRSTAVGVGALQNNTGGNNDAFGFYALQTNTTGGFNSAFGNFALYLNTTGSYNAGFGQGALQINTTGIYNTAIGNIAMNNATTGSYNIAIGAAAGRLIADGTTSNTITDTSIYIGFNTKALANNQTNQVVIGHNSTGLGSNTTVLGNSSTVTTAIYGNLLLGTTASTASALLSMASTTQGFLQPVMTTTQKNAISSPATGLSVYDSTVNTLSFYNGSAWSLVNNPSARNEQNFTATAGQTTFTVTAGYVVGLVDVFVNGVRYLPSDYTATNGSTVVLGVGLLAGDTVTILNYTSVVTALPTSRNVQDFTATAAQTTFTVTNGYIVGLIDVFVNGSKLTSSEFTATNGTTFVLTVASTVGDQVQSINYTASVNGISGAGTANYVPKFTASGTIGNSSIQDLTTGVLVSNSVTAASAIARGTYLTPTLVASANSDVLVGLDINPTFTNGAFTGVSNYGLRVQSALRINGQVDFSNGWNFYINGNANFNNGTLGNVATINSGNFTNSNLLLNTQHSTSKLILASGANVTALTIFPTSNIVIQNGGTFTDAGYRLDVVGTARVSGAVTFSSGQTGGYVTSSSGYVNETKTVSTNATSYYLIKSTGTSNGSSSTIFDITGMSTSNGTYADIYAIAQKDATASAINTNVSVTINGQYLNLPTIQAGGTAANTVRCTFRVCRMESSWVIIGTPNTSYF